MEDEIEEVEESTVEEVVEQVEETTTEEVEETEETEEVAEVEEPEKKAALPKGVQKRIDKITRQRHDADRRIQALEYELANRPEAKQASNDRPTEEQFDFDQEKYTEALTEWKVEQKFAAMQKQSLDNQKQSRQNADAQDFEVRKQLTKAKGAAKYDDFEEVTNSDSLVCTPLMADTMFNSPLDDEIAYHLAKNPEESLRISQLPPQQQIAAVVRLEAQLTAKPTKKISSAGKPVKTVGSKGSSTTKLDPVKDYAKWAEARNKEEAGR